MVTTGLAQPSPAAPPPAEAKAARPETPLEIEALQEGGEGEVDFATGIVTYRNGVIVKYGQAVLTADAVTANRNSGQVTATGNVVLVGEGGHIWRGERLDYNFQTRVMGGQEFRTGQPPFFCCGSSCGRTPGSGTN